MQSLDEIRLIVETARRQNVPDTATARSTGLLWCSPVLAKDPSDAQQQQLQGHQQCQRR